MWASQYPSNDGKDGRVDLIRCDHKAGKIVATKLTGNRFVPAGKVSFEAILHKNGMMGRGRPGLGLGFSCTALGGSGSRTS